MRKICFILMCVFFVNNAYSQILAIRPNASAGYYKEGSTRGMSYSYGGNILLMANEFQRYGILLNHLTLEDNKSYLSVGIILEQILFRYFNMGIGTVGYIGLQSYENPFGLYSHLGFEYPFAKRFHFLIAYKSDFIFSRQFISNNAVIAGGAVQF